MRLASLAFAESFASLAPLAEHLPASFVKTSPSRTDTEKPFVIPQGPVSSTQLCSLTAVRPQIKCKLPAATNGFFPSQPAPFWSTARGEGSCSPSPPGAVKALDVGMLRALYGWRLLQLCKAINVFAPRFLQQLLIMFSPVRFARFVALWGRVNARAFCYFSKFSSQMKADSLVFL